MDLQDQELNRLRTTPPAAMAKTAREGLPPEIEGQSWGNTDQREQVNAPPAEGRGSLQPEGDVTYSTE